MDQAQHPSQHDLLLSYVATRFILQVDFLADLSTAESPPRSCHLGDSSNIAIANPDPHTVTIGTGLLSELHSAVQGAVGGELQREGREAASPATLVSEVGSLRSVATHAQPRERDENMSGDYAPSWRRTFDDYNDRI